MTLTWPTKDPDEILDYRIDWSERFEGVEIIATSDWEVPAGLVKESESKTVNTTTIWLSGGAVLGRIYKVHNRITTSGGRTMDQTVQLKVNKK